MSPSDRSATLSASATTTPTMRVQEIRTALHRGEWWIAARLISEAHHDGDHIIQGGSFGQWCSQIPISRVHAYRLKNLHATGHAEPAKSLRAALTASPTAKYRVTPPKAA